MKKYITDIVRKCRAYGPYFRKDGRQHTVLVFHKNGVIIRRQTVSYPKWLMEQKLGRELDPELETIDHIDCDFTNNDFSNLRILSRSEHTKLDCRRTKKVLVKCNWCHLEIEIKPNYLLTNLKYSEKYSGPFCSKKCSGEYGASVQNGGKILYAKTLKKDYFKLKNKK